MPCKVCRSCDMAKAHIFPRALVHEMKDGGPVVHAIDRAKRGVTNYQSGPWEPDILCKACEAKLSGFDDYAVRWIRNFKRKAVPIIGDRGFEVPNSKPDLLVQFAASVLWRASAARKHVQPDLDLGPYEPVLRSGVFEDSGYQPRLFIARKRYVTDGAYHGSIVVHPYRAPKWAHRAYAFELGDLLWGLKLDQRRHGDKLFNGHFAANGKTKLIVINMGENELSEQSDLMEIFAASEGLTWNID